MKIKITFAIFFICTLISCDGTLGGFKTRIFPVSKVKIVLAIDSLYKENPEIKIPEKWKENDSWKKRGYGFLDTRIFYLKNNPEEMYYVSFIGDGNDSIQSDKSLIRVAVRAVFTNRYRKWFYEKDFDENERKRIEDRFDSEIISKLEKYTGVKAETEN